MVDDLLCTPRHATPRHATSDRRSSHRGSGSLIALCIAAAWATAPIATTSCKTTGPEACGSCNENYLHECFNDAPVGTTCTDEPDPTTACVAAYGAGATGEGIPCSDIPIGTTGEWGTDGTGTGFDFCSNWDPSSQVTFNSSTGVYDIDGPWFDEVVDDPRPLVHCDDAEVEHYYFTDPRTGTIEGYEVSDASSGEFLYELGLRNNEVITEINGATLTSYEDAADVFFDLYRDQNETDYTVTVDCIFGCPSGSYPKTRSYHLDYP